MIEEARALLKRSPLVSDAVAAELVAERGAGWLPPGELKNARKLAERAVREARKSLKAADGRPGRAAISLDAAGGFVPKPGEEPDEDGNYWRTVRGRRIPFKEGQDFQMQLADYAGPGDAEKMRRFTRQHVRRMPELGEKRSEKATERTYELSAEYAEQSVLRRSEIKELVDSLDEAVEDGALDGEEADQMKRSFGAWTDSLGEELAEMKEQWEAAAAKNESVRDAWEELNRLKREAAEEMAEAFKKAKSFYRGATMAELSAALREGGVAPALDEDDETDDPTKSLTAVYAVAVQFGSGFGEGLIKERDPHGIVIEYDAESVRKTGEARPMKYDFMQQPGYFDGGKVLALDWAHQAEITVPDGLKGPRITGVTMTREGALDHPELVGLLKKKGVKLTVLDRWELEDMHRAVY